MNEGHAELCSSSEWAEFIARDVVPSALAGVDPGDQVLEIGPGYGAATAMLAATGVDLTAIEVDPALADRLRTRYPSVRTVQGRGEDLSFPDATFTAVLSFTMLHHVHTVAAQDAIFAQAHRVLRPGGVFAGSDSIASPRLEEFHHDDVYVPVDPHTLGARLEAVGFGRVQIQIAEDDAWFSFSAHRS